MKKENITPEKFKCATVACPSVYLADDGDRIIIIGKEVDLKDVDLVDEVGDDELAVSVDAEMLKQADLDQ